MRALVGLVALALALTLGAGAPAAADDAGGGFPIPLPTAPEGDVPGVNDWSCRPAARRPRPVILVHGTFGDRRHLLEKLSMTLVGRGYCVFSIDYGNRATGPIRDSARQLKRFTNRVLLRTGAEKVSMIGHSQGGMMPRYYIKFLGGKGVVDDLIGLAPSNHGTRLVGGSNPIADLVHRLLLVPTCFACVQQNYGSPFLQRLNAGDETPGPVSYTQITTRLDTVVIPHTSGYLAPGPRSTNVTIQNLCPADLSEHILIPTSNTAIAVALNALRREGRPARKGFDPCP